MKCKLDPDDLTVFRNKVETGQSRRDGRRRWRDNSGDHSETLWVNLANEDANWAYQALWKMVSQPAATIPFLEKHLAFEKEPDRERIDKLVNDLNSPSFDTREQATKDLDKIAELAEPTFRSYLAKEIPPELKRRLKQLQVKLENTSPNGESLRKLRDIEALEQIGTTKASVLLENISKGAPQSRVTREAKKALERMDRVKPSKE